MRLKKKTIYYIIKMLRVSCFTLQGLYYSRGAKVCERCGVVCLKLATIPKVSLSPRL